MITRQSNAGLIVLKDVILDTDFPCISQSMRSRLRSGRYERSEFEVIPRLIDEGDRVLEPGGGIGFVSTLFHKTKKGRDLVVVEAHPGLIPVINLTHTLNAVHATVIHGVPVSPTGPGSTAVMEQQSAAIKSTTA
jgi:hypothetical protein